MTDQVVVRLGNGQRTREVHGNRVAFSAWQCFRLDGSAAETTLLRTVAADLLKRPGLIIYGNPDFAAALVRAEPALQDHAIAIIDGQTSATGEQLPEGLSLMALAELSSDVKTVFHAETSAVRLQQLVSRLGDRIEVLGPEHVVEIAPDLVPAHAWTTVQRNIYPLRLPEIRLEQNLDMILVDCPARNLALMPNGLGYVHNALKRADIRFQTFDLDILAYHRFHIHRLFDVGGTVVLRNGRELPIDPWQAEHYDLWNEPAVVDFFTPLIEEASRAIIAARPKVLGLSIQECNETLSRELVRRVKAALPQTVILVGGFSCYNADVGLRAFPDAEYMCIGEADLTVGPLVEALARGERPANVPGVRSRYDSPAKRFVPAPMPHDLDKLDFPRYEWFDLSIYRNYNGYQLTPIIASRGCRWSRCTFCAERFYWRIRSPENFVNELEWLAAQGCSLFMFNESDLNGMPEKLLDICDEIIRRGVKVKLTGQLRIHKKSDKAFYQKLREAGVSALRFGVDAFSESGLRLQKKGYTKDMVSQNLKDCWESGIYTEVNWVIGVPGETEEDTDEAIEFILQNREYIGRLSNINPLILINGSVYWIDPDAHGIKFRQPRDELYAKYPRIIPSEHWYSTEPYIDSQVRKQRFERIVRALIAANFPVGPWAQRIIDAVEKDVDGAGGIKIRDVKSDPTAQPSDKEFLRAVGNHKLYRYGNRYVGVPSELDVNLDELVVGRDGVVGGATETEAVAAIELAADWANSRGHFDPRKRQRAFGSEMRAGSFLGEERIGPAPARPVIFTFAGDRYAVSADELVKVTGDPEAIALKSSPSAQREPMEMWHSNRWRRVFDRGVRKARHLASAVRHKAPEGWHVRSVTSIGAVPELLRTIGNYNLVQFDGMFYGLPHGLPVDWVNDIVADLPGVFTADTARSVLDRINAVLAPHKSVAAAPSRRSSGPMGDILHVPTEIGRQNGYRIVSYEGWIYGLPDALSGVNLVETDVMELPGVIRDVSRDVVEHIIQERTGTASDRAAAVGD